MPIKASIIAPVEMEFADLGDHRSFDVAIRARSQGGNYPNFRGKLSVSKLVDTAELELRGQYTTPFGWVGNFADSTFMRNVAASTLQRFLDDLATNMLRETRSAGSSLSTHVGATAERSKK